MNLLLMLAMVLGLVFEQSHIAGTVMSIGVRILM